LPGLSSPNDAGSYTVPVTMSTSSWGTGAMQARLQANEDIHKVAAVGCAEVLVDGEAHAYYTDPLTQYPHPRIYRTYPSMSYFYALNFAPGAHEITFRVGQVGPS
jgi:hypothetical protein